MIKRLNLEKSEVKNPPPTVNFIAEKQPSPILSKITINMKRSQTIFVRKKAKIKELDSSVMVIEEEAIERPRSAGSQDGSDDPYNAFEGF